MDAADLQKPPARLMTVHEADKNGNWDTVYQGANGATMGKRTFKPSSNAYSEAGILGLSGSSSSSVTAAATAGAQRLGVSFELLQSLINIFLPTGFPHSVTSDYLGYQWYDSVQAFCSSIASLFANRAVLSAVGVGDKDATSTSALFMKITQETIGRLGTILFAWKLGSALEPECKKYRYLADLVNDSAIVLDCLSPIMPAEKSTKVILLCMSGLLRSICGVLAGGSRAALTQHFTDPNRGSIADVNAKDQSQETVISLMGMLVGSVVVKYIDGEGVHMWITVLVLLALHLYTNYQAVSCVVMETLNRQRANILFSDIIRALPEFQGIKDRVSHSDSEARVSEKQDGPSYDTHRPELSQALSRLILSPRVVSMKERILEIDGALRWYEGGSSSKDFGIYIGHAEFTGFQSLLDIVPPSLCIETVFDACDTTSSGYVIFFNSVSNIRICLTSARTASSELRAWVHALLIARWLQTSTPPSSANFDPIQLILQTKMVVNQVFDALQIEQALPHTGWVQGRYAVASQPVRSITIVQRESVSE